MTRQCNGRPGLLPFDAKSSFRATNSSYSFPACSSVIHHSCISQCRSSLSAYVSLEDTVVVAAEMFMPVILFVSAVCPLNAYEVIKILFGVNQLGKDFTSTLITDLHPFQTPSVCLVLSPIDSYISPVKSIQRHQHSH